MDIPVQKIELNVASIYAQDGTARLDNLPKYEQKAFALLPDGVIVDVCLTGAGPIWLYLKIAHALHGRVRVLSYYSPAVGTVVIFDHTS